MYPYPVLFGMTLYEWMIVRGFVLAVASYRVLSDRKGYEPALQNLTILGGTFGIAIGYYAAVLVQAFYNYLESGTFDLSKSTGATFLGGLMGGAVVFFSIYFGIGALVYRGKDNLTLRKLRENVDIAITCVVAAHACGRLGCLFAGCCHGAVVDGFPGLWNESLGTYTIPIPLYEALFLLGLYLWMGLRVLRGKRYQMVIYLTAYGIWRFFIEFFRADDRGETIVSALTPSQLTSLIMLLLAAVLFALQRRADRAAVSPPAAAEPGEQERLP